MVPGEKRRLWIPEALAYKGAAGKPKGMLVFDVELIDMPNRAAGRRQGAAGRREEDGERSRLQSAAAKASAAAIRKGSSSVTVHYTRLDDRRQDVRQLGRARAAGDVPLDGVIPGWTEGCS